jgi:glycosyltransferase involved in cell wall biosynthesis
MKILHTVQSYLPERNGMSEVVRQLSERLVKRGHQVVVATSSHPQRTEQVIEGVKVVEFNIQGSITDGIRGEYDRYIRFIREHTFDIMTNFAAQQWASDLVYPLLPEITAKKVFVPTGFSALYLEKYRDYFERMKTWLKQYDMNVFLAEDYRDVQFAREARIDHQVLIPNGAAEEEFSTASNPEEFRQKLGIRPSDFMVLHVGDYTGAKGHLEAVQIFSRAHIRNAVLVMVSGNFGQLRPSVPVVLEEILRSIIGRNKNKANIEKLTIARILAMPGNQYHQKRIINTSLSRKETIAAFQTADLFLFPSNIECSPIVLFESAASKTPFLSSDAGNAGEIARWTGGGMILPTSQEKADFGMVRVDVNGSARLLESFWRDRSRGKAMGEAAFKAWQNKFTWEKITDQYETLYANLMKE